MKKIITFIIATVMTVSALVPMTALAADKTCINSIGSDEGDIAIINDDTYEVKGIDSTQNKKSAYEQYEVSETQETITTEVYATVEENSVLVTYPTVLIMDGQKDASGYWVGTGKVEVKGDISGKTIVNVIPQDADSTKDGVNFTMKQDGKADITATVEQEYTQFVIAGSSVTGAAVNKNVTPDFNNAAVSTITVKTNEASAGSWKGSYETLIFLSYAD